METEALLVMLLELLDTADELPNGAGSPLAGDCRICTGGRIVVLDTLAGGTDEEVLVLDVGTALIGFFGFGTAMDGVAALEPTVLSATSFAKVPPTTLPPPSADEFFMVFFNDCIICVYDPVHDFAVGGREDDMRFPSFARAAASVADAAAAAAAAAAGLEETIRGIWMAFPPEVPAKRFFAAGGRAGIPPVIDFPVAAARTAEAVTALFGLDATKMFFPFSVPEAAAS